jgi:hypothetical protein
MSRSRTLVLVLVLVSLPGFLLGTAWSLSQAPDSTALAAVVLQSLGFTAVGVVAVLLTVRRPDNSIGWVFLGLWTYYVVFLLVTTYAQWTALYHPQAPAEALATWFVNWGWVPLFGVLGFYPLLLFPTGRPMSPRLDSLVVVGGLVIAAWTAAFAFQSDQYSDAFGVVSAGGNPYAAPAGQTVVNALPMVLAFAYIALVVTALVTLVLRFRRGDPTTRAQLKWFVLGAACWLPVLLYPGDHGGGGFIDVLAGLAIAAVPVAMGVAILRYRLYDIDRVISRALSYAVVTGVLLATYAVVVTATTRLLPDSSNPAVAAATLAAAAVAQPVLRQVRHVVDRRFNRSRYDAEQTVDAFGARLRNEVEEQLVVDDLRRVVGTTLEPQLLGVWVRGAP